MARHYLTHKTSRLQRPSIGTKPGRLTTADWPAMGDSAAVGSQGAAAAPGIPAVEPATDASCDRRWRRFGEYGTDEAARAPQRGRVRTAPAAAGCWKSSGAARSQSARRLRSSTFDDTSEGFRPVATSSGLPSYPDTSGALRLAERDVWVHATTSSARKVALQASTRCRLLFERCVFFNPPFEVLLTCVPASHSCIVPGLEAFHVRKSGRGVST